MFYQWIYRDIRPLTNESWPWNVRDTELDMYADDSTQCATGKANAILEEKLKADTDKIVMWCDENRMATNDQKTKSMLITYQKFYKLPTKQLRVFIRDYKIEFVRIEQLLGESIDQNLT